MDITTEKNIEFVKKARIFINQWFDEVDFLENECASTDRLLESAMDCLKKAYRFN